MYAAFVEATVYAQRPERPGVLVADVPGRGLWTVVFSRLERLAAYAGECEYLSTTGADFLDLVPDGVAVMVDPDDEHRFPVLAELMSKLDRRGDVRTPFVKGRPR
ncbi:SseB family protein [Amycolatopsis anabasis]|uniref:SseB family protein n=1 Tax=Amycolatopsis anabasis TaxID=1840409 RepID=UPI001C555458|nr:SseB family protein [Amycolatopsis anabasis]